MNRPEIIFFDFGETLVIEDKFDLIAANQAILDHCVSNPDVTTAEEMLALTRQLDKEIGRFHESYTMEQHIHAFQRYLFEYLGLKLTVSQHEAELLYWETAAPGRPVEHIADLLDYLQQNGIRSAVISNNSFSDKALTARIDKLIPNNSFEFIISTAEYTFRKPNSRIFDLALRKAGLPPTAAWHCGDHIYFDVQGAIRAGITPVWYTKEDPQANYYSGICVSDWLQLVEILQNC